MEISKALIDRIFSNLGIKSNTGVLSKNNLINKKIKFNEEDLSIKEYDVFAAECHVSSDPIKIIISDIGYKFPDFIVCILQENTVIVLRYDYNDSGKFLIKYNKKWVDMTVLSQLTLTSATEMIVQNGFIWTPSREPEQMFNILVNILKEDF